MSPEELQKLKEHKYSVDNLSLTEPYLQVQYSTVQYSTISVQYSKCTVQ